MTVAEVFTNYVAPAIGNVLAVILLLSPTPAVLRAKRIQHLEDLNVLPYLGTLCVCTALVGYGLVLEDIWLVPGNIIGACAGLWFSLSVIPFMTRKHQEYMMAFILGTMLFYSIFSTIGVFVVSDNAQKQVWGICMVVTMLFYYALPLSTIGTIITTRNSASIYMPLAICAILNGTAWTIYGWLALGDLYVWMPQLVGAVLGVVQVLLRLVIPAKPYQHDTLPAPPEAVSVHTNGAYEDKEQEDGQTRVRVVVQDEETA